MEKRRYNRTELKSKLVLKQLDGSAHKEVSIEVCDISKAGVGFNCTEPLTIGGIYEGFLTIWTKEVIHAFLEVVRIEMHEDYFEYGAIFVGMPDMDSKRIEIYQQVEELTKK
ncbi:MAG: PilZ domain-containing protein [Lachnospiraceae bacterium]|jgi:hypothetical protein|nr:PilZ domain-containing protein [Lachnospiraceae bacterium]MBR3636185.1 PilZ domain-containing protein [Lachnospiraceae bacterium]